MLNKWNDCLIDWLINWMDNSSIAWLLLDLMTDNSVTLLNCVSSFICQHLIYPQLLQQQTIPDPLLLIISILSSSLQSLHLTAGIICFSQHLTCSSVSCQSYPTSWRALSLWKGTLSSSLSPWSPSTPGWGPLFRMTGGGRLGFVVLYRSLVYWGLLTVSERVYRYGQFNVARESVWWQHMKEAVILEIITRRK